MAMFELNVESRESFMRLALGEADEAALRGEVPVGCVLVDAGGAVISSGHNLREATEDPTAHAEIVAVRRASETLGTWRLENVTAFVTLEPCLMCAGAFVHSRIGRVLYGCTDPKAGAMGTLFEIGRDARLNHRFEVEAGVLAGECAERLQKFFAALRARGKK